MNLGDHGLARTEEPAILSNVLTTNIRIGAQTEIPKGPQQEMRLMDTREAQLSLICTIRQLQFFRELPRIHAVLHLASREPVR